MKILSRIISVPFFPTLASRPVEVPLVEPRQRVSRLPKRSFTIGEPVLNHDSRIFSLLNEVGRGDCADILRTVQQRRASVRARCAALICG